MIECWRSLRLASAASTSLKSEEKLRRDEKLEEDQ